MPEPFSEHLEAQASIILHPGSRYLRIGRPSDSVPHTILHAIARRRRSGISSYSDPFLVPHVKLDGDAVQELEECRLKVSHILQSSLMSDGSRRFATPPQQIAVYNKRIQPIPGDETETSPPWVFTDKDYIVGDEQLDSCSLTEEQMERKSNIPPQPPPPPKSLLRHQLRQPINTHHYLFHVHLHLQV
ncbi:hypothetical protein O3P69_001750 [Scylla paramamosain]|uniref:Actin-related protein 8 n=1 Tax=Scylla paramamosain TaxID=85552 RepID=A0AAW0V0A5_SCYPA